MDLSKFKLKAAEAEIPHIKSEPTFFNKGRFDDVQIVEVTEKPVKDTSKDKTWFTVQLVLGLGARKIHHFIEVPTVTFTHATRKDIPFQMLVRFMKTIGLEVDETNVADLIPLVFGVNFDKLVGKKLSIEVGYDGAYAAKTEAGILLHQVDGKPILCEDGVNPLVFPDWDAAASYAEGLKINFSKFPKVTKTFPATQANDVSDLTKIPEKKVRKIEF